MSIVPCSTSGCPHFVREGDRGRQSSSLSAQDGTGADGRFCWRCRRKSSPLGAPTANTEHVNRRDAEESRATLTCSEIAARIDAHLRRFEADPKINERGGHHGGARFFRAGAGATRGWVHVTYVSYQGSTAIRKGLAEKYLAWLDAGNVGAHFHLANDWPPR